MLVLLLGLVLVRVRCVTRVLKVSIADFALNCNTLKLTIFATVTKLSTKTKLNKEVTEGMIVTSYSNPSTKTKLSTKKSLKVK